MGSSTVKYLKDIAGNEVRQIKHHAIRINGRYWYDGIVIIACILISFLVGFIWGLNIDGILP